MEECMSSIFHKYICQEENFFSVFNQMCNPKYTVQPKEEASTSKAHFTLYSKPTRAKKIEHLGKKSQKSQKLPCRNMCFCTKPSKIDDFNEAEEKEVKEHIEERKMKRREVAEKNKLVKKRKKKEKNK